MKRSSQTAHDFEMPWTEPHNTPPTMSSSDRHFNRIVRLDWMTDGKVYTRLGPGCARYDKQMITHPLEANTYHLTWGGNKFRIIWMLDEQGNTPPTGKVNGVCFWYKDRDGQY